MVLRATASGIRFTTRRLGLAGLLYGIGLAIGLVVTVPLAATLSSIVGASGFDDVLAERIDIGLLVDLVRDHPKMLTGLLGQLIWIVPLLMVWEAVSSVGIVHAARDGGVRSFWDGIGRYGVSALSLAGLFVFPGVVLAFATIVLIVIGIFWVDGEVGTFWWQFVFVPTFAVFGLATIDLMHDFGRILLVARGRGATASWLGGMLFPLRHGQAGRLYTLWFVPAALLILLPSFVAGVLGSVVAAFVLQQILLFGRYMVKVGWLAGEVALYEHIQLLEAPLIAANEHDIVSTPAAPA